MGIARKGKRKTLGELLVPIDMSMDQPKKKKARAATDADSSSGGDAVADMMESNLEEEKEEDREMSNGPSSPRQPKSQSEMPPHLLSFLKCNVEEMREATPMTIPDSRGKGTLEETRPGLYASKSRASSGTTTPPSTPMPVPIADLSMEEPKPAPAPSTATSGAFKTTAGTLREEQAEQQRRRRAAKGKQPKVDTEDEDDSEAASEAYARALEFMPGHEFAESESDSKSKMQEDWATVDNDKMVDVAAKESRPLGPDELRILNIATDMHTTIRGATGICFKINAGRDDPGIDFACDDAVTVYEMPNNEDCQAAYCKMLPFAAHGMVVFANYFVDRLLLGDGESTLARQISFADYITVLRYMVASTVSDMAKNARFFMSSNFMFKVICPLKGTLGHQYGIPDPLMEDITDVPVMDGDVISAVENFRKEMRKLESKSLAAFTDDMEAAADLIHFIKELRDMTECLDLIRPGRRYIQTARKMLIILYDELNSSEAAVNDIMETATAKEEIARVEYRKSVMPLRGLHRTVYTEYAASAVQTRIGKRRSDMMFEAAKKKRANSKAKRD